jgi:hypothetical protein
MGEHDHFPASTRDEQEPLGQGRVVHHDVAPRAAADLEPPLAELERPQRLASKQQHQGFHRGRASAGRIAALPHDA